MQPNPISWAMAAYRSLPLFNVSDTWLSFLMSIILTVKQNDCVKDKKSICQQPVPGNLIVASEY